MSDFDRNLFSSSDDKNNQGVAVNSTFVFSNDKFKFGSAGLGRLNVITSYSIHYTKLYDVGIFQANFKLGIFMMLIVSMFEYAWRPFFLNNAKEPNAKQIFSRVV